MSDQKTLNAITERLIEQGLLVEAGFQAFCMLTIKIPMSNEEISTVREAFFSGAQHLFGSIMITLDPGKEPTDNDINRMRQISMELSAFAEAIKQKYGLHNDDPC